MPIPFIYGTMSVVGAYHYGHLGDPISGKTLRFEDEIRFEFEEGFNPSVATPDVKLTEQYYYFEIEIGGRTVRAIGDGYKFKYKITSFDQPSDLDGISIPAGHIYFMDGNVDSQRSKIPAVPNTGYTYEAPPPFGFNGAFHDDGTRLAANEILHKGDWIQIAYPRDELGTSALFIDINIGGKLVRAWGDGYVFRYQLSASDSNDFDGISIPAGSTKWLHDEEPGRVLEWGDAFEAVPNDPRYMVHTQPLVKPTIAEDNTIFAIGTHITGTGGAGDRIILNLGDSRGFTTVGSDGRWSYALSWSDVNAMGQGDEAIRVTAARDTPGALVTSELASRKIFVDTGAPVVPLNKIAAGTGGFVINGQASFDYSGRSVAMAGDVNGDGLDDIIVGAHTADSAAGQDTGRSYVVYGTANTAAINLSAVANGTGGFVINGQEAYGYSGMSVAAAGDVNGDGLADMIVGAPSYGSDDSGRAYVVYGKANNNSQIDLSAVANGTGGFVIKSPAAGAGRHTGLSVAGAGDFNGDGLADVIVGSPGTAQAASIVFGKSNANAVTLGGSGSIAINAGHYAGLSVAAAGDVNGDGLADVIVAANEDHGNGDMRVQNYVVFGRTGTANISLGDVYGGAGGFVIKGQTGANSNVSLEAPNVVVAGAGDVNGDGRADLIVTNYQQLGTKVIQRSFVVFGKNDGNAVDLNDVGNGTGGFVINGNRGDDRLPDDHFGSVSTAGDFNGDGLADLIVSAAGRSGLNEPGYTYVVFGKSGTTPIELSEIAKGRGGFMISGQAGDNSGVSVSGGGDINGDGLADLIVGADMSDAMGGNSGRTYVIFGSANGSTGASAVDFKGTATGTTASETFMGSAGNDTIRGNGGADVIYAGAGDDFIRVNQSMLDALYAPLGSGGNIARLARVSGGGGFDTLEIDGNNMTLDLTKIANQGNSSGAGMSRLDSIERIGLAGGYNKIKLEAKDVLDLSGEANHRLIIDGDGSNAVIKNDWLTGTSTVKETTGGHTYNVYTQANVRLLIDEHIKFAVL